MPIAYEGAKPYIFVSYSHRDMGFVHQVITHLQDAGYRVWFDGGIEAGSEWPEYIATHLEGCSCVLTFISKAFAESDNCKRELNFAQDLKKPLLNVYIEEVALTAGMRMQLGLSQAMYRSNFRNDKDFMESLARARILEACREKTVQKVVLTTAAAKDPDPEDEGIFDTSALQEYGQSAGISEEAQDPFEEDLDEIDGDLDEFDDLMDDEEEEDSEPMSGKMKLLGWLTILLELSYCVFWPKVLGITTGSELNVWLLILILTVPHVAVAIVNRLILRGMSGRTTYSQRSDFVMGLFFLSPVVAVIASFTGIAGVRFAVNGFLKFLISLGLNVLPAIIVIFIYLLMIGDDTEKRK